MSALQRPTIWFCFHWWQEGSMECLSATSFLGNVKGINLRKLVEDLITSYEELGCHMSLKVYFLHSHFNFFPVNCGAISGEQWEFSLGCLSDAEQMEGQMECCYVSWLLLDSEGGCSGNPVQGTSKKGAFLSKVTLLLPYSKIITNFNKSQSHNLNANLMFTIANSTVYTYFHFHNSIWPKICCIV